MVAKQEDAPKKSKCLQRWNKYCSHTHTVILPSVALLRATKEFSTLEKFSPCSRSLTSKGFKERKPNKEYEGNFRTAINHREVWRKVGKIHIHNKFIEHDIKNHTNCLPEIAVHVSHIEMWKQIKGVWKTKGNKKQDYKKISSSYLVHFNNCKCT